MKYLGAILAALMFCAPLRAEVSLSNTELDINFRGDKTGAAAGNVATFNKNGLTVDTTQLTAAKSPAFPFTLLAGATTLSPGAQLSFSGTVLIAATASSYALGAASATAPPYTLTTVYLNANPGNLLIAGTVHVGDLIFQAATGINSTTYAATSYAKGLSLAAYTGTYTNSLPVLPLLQAAPNHLEVSYSGLTVGATTLVDGMRVNFNGGLLAPAATTDNVIGVVIGDALPGVTAGVRLVAPPVSLLAAGTTVYLGAQIYNGPNGTVTTSSAANDYAIGVALTAAAQTSGQKVLVVPMPRWARSGGQ